MDEFEKKSKEKRNLREEKERNFEKRTEFELINSFRKTEPLTLNLVSNCNDSDSFSYKFV